MYPFGQTTDIDFAIWFTVALGFTGTFFPYLLLSWFTDSSSLLRIVRVACVILLLYGLVSVYDRYVRDEPQFALSYEEKRERIYEEVAQNAEKQ